MIAGTFNLQSRFRGDSDDSSEYGGAAILTPSTEASLSRRGSLDMEPIGDLDAALIHTPLSELFNPANIILETVKLGCQLCDREFNSLASLQAHMGSVAHSVHIYHCPTFLFPDGISLKNPLRKFKTLSGLVAHLEGGSCQGGEVALGNAISFLEHKLRDFGLGRLVTN